jgi:hypothetical protein
LISGVYVSLDIIRKLTKQVSIGTSQSVQMGQNEKVAAGALMFLYAMILTAVTARVTETTTVALVVMLVLLMVGAPWVLLLAIPVGELLSNVGLTERVRDDWACSTTLMGRTQAVALGAAVVLLASARIIVFGREEIPSKPAFCRLLFIIGALVLILRPSTF